MRLLLAAVALAILSGCFGEPVGHPAYVPICDEYAPAHYREEASWSGLDNDATMNLLAERGWKNVRLTEAKTHVGFIEADCILEAKE